MRTELLALLPGILAWWTIKTRSLEAAFFAVYLPVLLLIPDNFRLPIDGLPDPTFSQAAILPIGVVVFWRAIFNREWTLSVLDCFVFAFVIWQFVSDFHNVGYVDAQNLAFDMVTLALFPYVCGKALIEPFNLRLPFAKRFVWLLFVVGIFSMYEFRMGYGLFRPPFGRFFPGQGAEWTTQLRWGLGRIAGPYGHSILMGSILAVSLLLCIWIGRSGQWERHFRWLGELPLTKYYLMIVGILAAIGMTLSRGSWTASMCGIVLAWVGFNSKPRRAFRIACLSLAVIGCGMYFGGKEYLAPPPTDALHVSSGYTSSEVEQSTAYRAILFDKYVDIAMKSPFWGWGRANWPQVPGMASIDNNYLFVALNTGLVGLGLFLAMIVVAGWRLVLSGFSAEQDPQERAFHFTLLGVFGAIVVSTASVYMGSQLYPLFFLFLGWADACTIGQFERAAAEQAAEQEVSVFDMVRVVA